MDKERFELNITNCQKYYFGSMYSGVRLENIKPINDWQKLVLPKTKKYLTNKDFSKGLYLSDKRNRTGKTYFQAAIYAEFARLHKKQKVFSDIQLEKYLGQQYFDNCWDEVKELVEKTDVFHFKDFGKIAESKDFAMPLLFDFFDILVSNQKTMIFCSNYKPVEISKFENKNWTSIAARIHENVIYV